MTPSQLESWSTEVSLTHGILIATALVQSVISPSAWVTSLFIVLGGFWCFGRSFVRFQGYRRPADWVTMFRFGLVMLLVAWFAVEPSLTWPKVLIAIANLVLDGVDGRLARYLGPTRFGAVFDMEADGFFISVLCLLCYLHVDAGPWIFLPAIMRPAFVFLLQAMQWFRFELQTLEKSTMRAKVIFVVMAVALIHYITPLSPVWVKLLVFELAFICLFYSFAADFVRMKPSRPQMV